MNYPMLRAVLLASLGASACVSDLSVGVSALEGDEDGAVAERDAGAHEADAGEAGAPRDASSCVGPDCPGDGGSDPTGDAGTPDGGDGSAEPPDAARPDPAFGEPCDPIQCEYVGLVRTLMTCDDDEPAQCVRDEEGACDLLCASQIANGPRSDEPAPETMAAP